MSKLDFYLAFEHWRAAVIKEGIHHRVLRGDARGDGIEDIGASVPLHPKNRGTSSLGRIDCDHAAASSERPHDAARCSTCSIAAAA